MRTKRKELRINSLYLNIIPWKKNLLINPYLHLKYNEYKEKKSDNSTDCDPIGNDLLI